MSVFKEFKDFISRGNVVDLRGGGRHGRRLHRCGLRGGHGPDHAAGRRMFGTAYGDMSFTINSSAFRYGIVLNAVIYFLVVAAVVFFFVVKPMNTCRSAGAGARSLSRMPELSDEAVLLAEIRDLLAAQAGRGDGGSSARPVTVDAAAAAR